MAIDVVPEGHGLPSTHWSEVDVAKNPNSPEGEIALASMLTRYRSPLIAHLRAKFQLNREDAEDIFQAFVEKKILEGNFIVQARPNRGRFRTFLLSSLDRFAISAIRHEQALKRMPKCDLMPLHELGEEETPAAYPDPTPESELDWTRAVIAGAFLDMRHSCHSKGQQELWTVFEERVLRPIMGDSEFPSYTELVQRFNLDSPSAAFNLLGSGKRVFRRHLLTVITAYVRDEGEVEDELAYLLRLLRRFRSSPPPSADTAS